MTPDERLEQLRQAAKEYIEKEKKALNAEYDFLDNILKKRGINRIDNANTSTASNLFVSSLSDFLGS